MSERVPTISAAELADRLDQPVPTAEQAAIIEAPLRPLLVVAGAGSGKTETMTSRVVWLVANGLVAPDQVLGLTFTRKAAGELAERVGRRVTALRQSGVWGPDPAIDEASGLGVGPTISTYHSYAGRLVRENAPRLGYERDSRLLSEAATWQLAHEVVLGWDGDMTDLDKVEATVTNAVVSLAGEMAEHLQDSARLDDFLSATLDHLERVEQSGKAYTKAFTEKLISSLREQRMIVPIVQRYLAVKRERSVLDFSDQMALAARLAREVPEVGAAERERFRVVLLDEFQDTSEAQMVVMRELFAPPGGDPAAVTAVGDPHQSIYAWRGASATTLSSFPMAFAASDGTPAPVAPLSTSWRNDTAILTVANRLAGPLRDIAAIDLPALAPRPGAGQGQVEAIRTETAVQEAAQVAEWIRQRRAGGRRTAAVLCRKRSQFTVVVEALAHAGVPYEVVGLGGLLLTAEVADVIALLTVVQDPGRGDRLMRLLTGPPGLLGAADLDGLGAWARHLGRRGVPEGERGEPVSIVDALEELPPAGWTGQDGQGLSEVGRQRLEMVAAMVRHLRRLTGLSLPDLVGEAERTLGVDVEVLARPGWSPGAARAHLDAFADVASRFAASADRPTLGGFLDWIEAALVQERGLEAPVVEPTRDAVQVLTCHAAKGLEWDAVALPGLNEGVLPSHNGRAGYRDGAWQPPRTINDSGWVTGLDGLPYPLRGDAGGLPHLDLALTDRDALQKELTRFTEAGGAHGLLEERRLAYVASTRARRQLLLGSWVWGPTGSTPRWHSRFLQEALDTGEVKVLAWAEMPEEEKPVNPLAQVTRQATWPAPRDTADPGLARGDSHADASPVDALTADALTATDRNGLGAGEDPLDETIELLLAERAERRRARSAPVEVDLPAHLSTTQVVALARDPHGFAVDLRRPMPRPPQVAGRRGTAFHAWVEEHYTQAGLVDYLELPGNADEDRDDADLALMQRHFLASEWANRVPIEVELSLETVIAGRAVRGRVDAVFATDDGVVIVDWKTGPPPRGEEAQARAVQLSAYAIAYARWRDLEPERVRAAFFHAATGETVSPELLDEARLAALLTGAGAEPQGGNIDIDPDNDA